MSKQKILALLRQNPEGYTSGEAMSRQLGISRAAVSKAVSGLRQEGYDIRSATNRGYRLVSGPDRLTAGEIEPWLHVTRIGTTLECFETIDSTNNYLKREAHRLPDGAVAVANEQTGGRGRLGRSFQSPRDAGIYMSALVRPQLPPERALNFTAFVAVAVCEGIEAATGLRPQIKWTNDIVLDRRKVCGILTEMSIEGESGALQSIVTGIGLNVGQRLEDFPEDIRDIAGSLAMAAGKPIQRGRLAAEVINALDRMYAAWRSDGGDYLEKYRARCLTGGREVRLLRADGRVEPAKAIAVAEDFGLLVRHPDGREEKVTSGEVSVRGLWGYVD
ncbi:MAG: biotin--[acetyl-CoA-carboxylase] ligase [Clostridiales bacterium]|nr:biotin--[acetyl-CoA-carboxylase] ligase [Clostridiales bacterium]